MSGIWFTADIHAGHQKVSDIRGFANTDEHDEALAREWGKRIQPDDQVWVLGDLTGKRGTEAAGLEWISQRPGIKHLITGNHDACHPLHREAHKAQAAYLAVFASVQQAGVRKIHGQKVLLSHFPYAEEGGDHTTVLRYPEWRFPDLGAWLLHGHTHSSVRLRGRQIHVGLDAHSFKPVPLRWVELQIQQGGGGDA